MRAAEAQGAELRLGRVTGITQYKGRATGVEVGDNVVEGDAMVIAMGPWSILAAWWLPLPVVFGLKGHSLVFDTGAKIPAEAAFLEYQERSGAVLTPELFPRTDGTTYVCAISSEEPLPVDPARVAPDPDAITRLEAMCSSMSPVLASAKILARQACYRPVTRDGLPLIGPVPGVAGAYIATGHSVWGILNAPATGEAMAELIVDGTARAVDLAPFENAASRSGTAADEKLSRLQWRQHVGRVNPQLVLTHVVEAEIRGRKGLIGGSPKSRGERLRRVWAKKRLRSEAERVENEGDLYRMGRAEASPELRRAPGEFVHVRGVAAWASASRTAGIAASLGKTPTEILYGRFP
jgi:FAD dependent oxidoreductase